MRTPVYLIRVEGVNFPPIFIDAKRFNRLVGLVAPLDISVSVIAISRHYEFVSANDLKVFSQIYNYFKHK